MHRFRFAVGLTITALSLAGAILAPPAPPRRVCIPTPWLVCNVPKHGSEVPHA